jgi:hypothetical protein
MGLDPKWGACHSLARGVKVVARFADARKARTARSTLNTTLDDLEREVSELFESLGGVVEGEQVARIYARAGLHNDVGWRQERPIIVRGEELQWELPEGAEIDDAENLLVSLGALSVVIHRPASFEEAWRVAPHPFPIELPFDEDSPDPHDSSDEDGYPTAQIPKRTLH